MALVWTLVRFLFCLFVVDAFPKFPRTQVQEYGYVVYRLPPRCVPPPRPKAICNLDHDITSYARMAHANITRSIKSTYDFQIYFSSRPDCAEAVKRLFCKSSFPECLDEGRLDYGDKNQLFADVKKECPGVSAKYFLTDIKTFRNMPSGIHKDPHAGFTCVDAPQDPQNVCPKPKYKLPSHDYIKQYYAQVAKVIGELNENKDEIPDECYEKAKNAFVCSYLFCSPDNERHLLMETTKQRCESVRDCLKDHGKLDNDTKTFMDETCPKYPDENSAEKVELTAVLD